MPKAVSFVLGHRDSPLLNLLFSIIVPLVTLFTTEWIARGRLLPTENSRGFYYALIHNFPSFFLAFVLLVCLYVLISQLTGLHPLATLLTGLAGNVPALVTYYKLTMRGEPFLPWDLTQIDDLMGVKSNLEFSIPHTVWVSLGILLLLFALSFIVRVPKGEDGKSDIFSRLIAAGAALGCGCILVFFIFLSPKGSAAMGIRQDMWMQDRYYRNNGVITGFLTNLQMLQIAEPEGYSREAVQRIADETKQRGSDAEPLFPQSFAAGGGSIEQQPDIFYVMAESFWDVTALPGIEYDREILPNLTALKEEAAYGHNYSPSFGGGTCDVEFEALTGFSMEYLPAGSKPYQQYLAEPRYALPWQLKSQGYQTLALHGYGRRFWNRDMAYPNLGIDEFIGSEGFVNPERRRGFISDNAMVDRIIDEYVARKDDGPMFVHTVTMQNHTTYSRSRYPAGELVKVTKAPETLPDSTIGQLEDCATGMYEMDAALGKLVAYLREADRPAIVVFWGDHMNPMSDGYALFEETGFIEKGDTGAPQLRQTPLLIWSNFDDSKVELGTLASYNITPVMQALYGLEKAPLSEYLTQQFADIRGRVKGVTIEPDSTCDYQLSEAQQQWFNEHAILQYDYLFGERLLEDYIPPGTE